MERYTMQTLTKKVGIVILISDKRKKINQKQKGKLYNKRVNSPRRYNNPKFVCTKQETLKTCKNDRIERKKKEVNSFSWRLQHLSVIVMEKLDKITSVEKLNNIINL